MTTFNDDNPESKFSVRLLMDETREQPSVSFSNSNWISNVKKWTREAYESKPFSHWILLILSGASMLIAFPASSLLSRLYFSNGGKSKWIISWVAVAGWPITCLILLPTYIFRKIKPTPLNGFFWDIMGSALHGLIFALSELVFVKLLGRRFFHVALEQQVMVSLVAFAFTSLGMVVSQDFQGMVDEAKSFKGGESLYIQVLVWSAVTFQLGVLGATAVLFLASTVMAGVLNAVRVPITSIAAVILMHDPMSGFKILSLLLTFWGFSSYIYGSSSSNSSAQASSSS